MGVEARENESFQLYLAYPDLLNEKASEHALASDAYWEGTVTDPLMILISIQREPFVLQSGLEIAPRLQ